MITEPSGPKTGVGGCGQKLTAGGARGRGRDILILRFVDLMANWCNFIVANLVIFKVTFRAAFVLPD